MSSGLTVEGVQLADALRSVVPFASKERKEAVLGCVLLHGMARSLRLAATDRHRLAVVEVPVQRGDGSGLRALVPTDGLDAIGEWGPGDLRMRFEDDSIRLEGPGGVHTLTAASGEFPDYEQFLAEDPRAVTAAVDRDALRDAIEQLADGKPLRFRVRSATLELGEPVATCLPVECDGGEAEVLLNAEYAHEAVTFVPGPRLMLDVAGTARPVTLRSAGHESHVVVVMPVRRAEPSTRRRK